MAIFYIHVLKFVTSEHAYQSFPYLSFFFWNLESWKSSLLQIIFLKHMFSSITFYGLVILCLNLWVIQILSWYAECWPRVSCDKNAFLFLVQGGHLSQGKFYHLLLDRMEKVREPFLHLLFLTCLLLKIFNFPKWHIMGWHVLHPFSVLTILDDNSKKKKKAAPNCQEQIWCSRLNVSQKIWHS